MSNNDWQDKLRSGMEAYSEPLPDSVWSGVQAGVGAAWDRQRRRRRRRMFAAGASVFAAAALGAVLILPERGTAELLPSARPALVSELLPTEELFRPGEPAALYLRARSKPAAAAAETLPLYEVLPGEVPPVAPSGNEGFSEPDPAAPAVDPPLQDDAPGPGEAAAALPDDVFAALASVEDGGRRGRLRVSLGLVASNLAPGRSETTGYGGLYGAAVFPAPYAQRDQMVSYTSVLLGNNSREVSTVTEHYQPVSVGLAVSLGLSRNLSVESGVNYSCLVSDMSSGTDDNRYDIRQTLHYIGVPLRLRLSFWRPGNFDFYLSAGGEVEKCVYGTSSTTYVVGSSARSTVGEKLVVDPLQWSLGASAGIGYRFSELIGIYLEPGISYYFDNGSFVETVYRERPLNFSLGLGLRFNLD